ncbi:MAG: reprolysin-like metallopeptidase [Dokdonia sp.]|jgi:hypothetical protein
MKNILLFLVGLAVTATAYAQNNNFFTQTTDQNISRSSVDLERVIVPDVYKTYAVDVDGLSSVVEAAQSRLQNRTSLISASFPLADGHFETFSIFDSEVMHPDLQAKYPQIRSYIGISQQDPLHKIHFTITPQGFRGVILGEKTIYMDPYAKGDRSNYIVYERSNLSRSPDDSWRCYYEEQPEALDLQEATPSTDTRNLQDGRLRRYEIAIACTSEYTAYHDDGNNANGDDRADALAAMVVTVARVNTVYEVDLAMTFQLVPDNDELIYSNGFAISGDVDPYDNYDGGQMLGVNTGNINGLIGSGAYDIGHVFSTGGGGIAGTSPCGTNKGAGVTGIVTPEFDPFDIDYVSHEIGHQFSAGHTYYNACFGSKVTEDYEPGSASTIMGYAGICVPNVQENSDAYFHATSIARITASVNGDVCEQEIVIANNEPTAVAAASYTIPFSTPFELDGSSSTDPDGDTLTYCWEQFDNTNGGAQPPVATNTAGPNFRTNFPTANPIRTMPNLEAVINNTTPTWEVLPSVARTMNFRLTVRDNNPVGGQTDQANTAITVSGTAGPFVVSSPNAAGVIWYAGATETVTWNVNGTNSLSSNVNILLSTDGGYTYPITLASGVPNNGSRNITVPDNVGTTNRIRIEAASNIFFDLSNNDFEIKPGTWEFTSAAATQNICQPDDAVFNFNYVPAVGYTETVSFSANNPAGTSVNFTPSSRSSAGPVTMTISGTGAIAAGLYPITLTGTSSPSNDVETSAFILRVFDNTIDDVTLNSPANGATNQSTGIDLAWDFLLSASSYDVQVSTSPDFSSLTESGTVNNGIAYTTTSLSPGTIYYWRVRPNNPCIAGDFGEIYSFQTANDVCITYDQEYFENGDNVWEATGTNAVSARVDVPDNIILSDVSFYMQADHGNINHIKMQFSSPSGRFAEIYNRDCSGSDFDVTFSDAGTPLTCGNVDPTTFASLEGIQQAGQLFTRFHGENAQGTWVLLATDRTNGTGGTFNEFSVRICGELQIVNDLTVDTNDILTITTGETKTIDQTLLESSQPGAVATDLNYVITRLPSNGSLFISGVAVTLGDTFTQEDINNSLLTYNFTGLAGETDGFGFTVTGNNSAIIGGQTFSIASPVTAPPVAVCQDFTADLGTNGQVTILASDIDNGSTDDGTIASYSLDMDTFDCSHVGTPQTVTLTVTDDEGQTDSCTATVTVTYTNTTAPSNLIVNTITATTAVATWDDQGIGNYNVRFRESASTPWTLITGITTNSTTLTGLTANTMYDVQVRAACGPAVSDYSLTTAFTTTTLSYCSSFSNDPAAEYISNVTLADTGDTGGPTGINNSSGSSAYTNFTAVAAAEIEMGTTPTISVNKTFVGGPWNEAVTVWIDYNQNGDFTDPGEQVVTDPADTNDLVNVAFSASVPMTATAGETRMRIAMKYFGTAGATHNDPCDTPGSYDFGEVEDYTVTIIATDPCPTTTIYSGSWDTGAPTASTKAVFDTNFTTTASDIEACSVEIAAGVTVTVTAGHYMRAQGNIVVNGTLIIEHEGSLVQVDDASTITKGSSGVIEVRKTTPMLKPRDFMFMSSPMTGETRDGVYGTVNGTDNAFRVIYLNPTNFSVDPLVSGYAPYAGAETFLSVDNTFLGNHTTNEALVPGEGLIVYPQASFTDGNQSYDLTYTKGTANNGIITHPINYNGTTANNFNLIGNPYPSAIDVSKLIDNNPMINEIYYWEHVTTPNNSLPGYLGNNPSMQDFSMRNKTTGMAAVNKPADVPTQYIASGQGFAIKADQGAAGDAVVVFNNDMRVTGNNDQYRSSTPANDLLWLKIENAAFELHSKAALGFLEEATSGIDRGYDSKRMATPLSIYTSVKTKEQLGIQGREAFDTSMQIPVGFATAIEEVTTYTISLDAFEGENLLATPMYLVDLIEERYVNLKQRDYTFTANMTNTSDRFMLVFEAPEVLGVTNIDTLERAISLYPNPASDTFVIGYTGSEQMSNARIIDTNGKVVQTISLKDFDQMKQVSVSNLAAGVYFVQIQGIDQAVVKKLIIQ